MTDKKLVWVTGCNGFVGSVICDRLKKAGFNVVGTDEELSVTESERLEAFAEEVQPGVIINCAGIRRDVTTLSNRVKAYEVNALGARNVALAANTIGATMVQVSSDNVYATRIDEPVNEFDNPQPDTPYGKSKRAGEMMVRNTTENHIILRSSWLYHDRGGRFKEVLDAAAKGERYVARTDQIAALTSMSTYIDFLVRAIEVGATGTFHVATKGCTSRYGFAEKILEFAGYDPSEILIPEEDEATAENLVLESMLLEIAGITMPTWKEDLASYMKEEGLYKL